MNSLFAAADLALFARDEHKGSPGEVHIHADLGLSDGKLFQCELFRCSLNFQQTLKNVTKIVTTNNYLTCLAALYFTVCVLTVYLPKKVLGNIR